MLKHRFVLIGLGVAAALGAGVFFFVLCFKHIPINTIFIVKID